MKIIFAGTPDVAIPTLQALAAADFEVSAVLTRPPARQGRSKKLIASPVAQAAADLGIPVIESSRPQEEQTEELLRSYDADLGVVVAYGAILRPSTLAIPRLGWINLHFSELPRWRGAAPVQHALLAGETQIGTSVFQLDPGMDTGSVYSSRIYPVPSDATTSQMLSFLAEESASQVVEVVEGISTGTATATPQDTGENGSLVTLAPMLSREDGFISFHDTAANTKNRIRAVTDKPGAWTRINGEQTLKLGPVQTSELSLAPGSIRADKKNVYVGCSEATVQLGMVAPAGKGWMNAADWYRGARLNPDSSLGSAQ